MSYLLLLIGESLTKVIVLSLQYGTAFKNSVVIITRINPFKAFCNYDMTKSLIRPTESLLLNLLLVHDV